MANKKIIITGATGFIGSHLTELFVRKVTKLQLTGIILNTILA